MIKNKVQRNSPVIPIHLDFSIAAKISKGGSMFPERTLMNRTDVWHKIRILSGAKYDKETILKGVLSTVEPADLIPINYQISGEDTFFLARNCGAALEKLCKSSLIIKCATGDPFILVVTLGYASIHDLKINIQSLLLTALTRRYDSDAKTLNLDEFQRDPEVFKVIYSPLSQQRAFGHILKLAKSSVATFETLSLQHNELVTLAPMENSNLTTVKYLDLRHNNLHNMDCLAALKNFPIIKLWLDGNPLCENYSNPKQYVESAKNYCPGLKELDGVYIDTLGMPLTYKNYFKNQTKRELTNKFIVHFFNLYDQGDRMVLRGLYHKDAFYSMSCCIAATLCHKRSLGQFTACRNILRSTDLAKKSQHISCGQDNVLASLKKLPRSYHEQDSFICDLMYEDDHSFVISVGGLLKTLTSSPQVLTFARTFVLVAGQDNEYNIVNDQYHVDTAPEDMTADRVKMKISYEEFVPMCFNVSEREVLKTKFSDATTLNDEWCGSYLEEAKWDIRKAITNFIRDYKSSAIPLDAFQK